MTNESIEILKGYRERLKQSVSNQLEADIKAFDEAIQALKSQRWIPVTERLPEIDGVYLASFSLIGIPDFTNIASFKDGHWETHNGYITAWMPRPQPYKAESEEEE